MGAARRGNGGGGVSESVNTFRGVMFAFIFSLAAWALIAWAYWP